MAKFTFKKAVPVGSYGSFDHTTIKLNKKRVGYIGEQRDIHTYKISFAVKKLRSEEDPAPFKWVHLKKTFGSEMDARAFVREHSDAIQDKYDLHFFDN